MYPHKIITSTIMTVLLMLLSAVPLLTVSAEPPPPPIEAGQDWCGTWKIYEQQLAQRYAVPSAMCDSAGPCDAPFYRDGYIPGPDEPIMYVRLMIHVLAQDDGSYLFSTPAEVQLQVDELNANYAPAGIQFVHEFDQVNSTAWRSLAENEINAMKIATAIEPTKYLNVWVTQVEFDYSFGTFPWTGPQTSLGGIVMGHFHWTDLPNRVFAHEVGHCLGLFHTFHGVEEVGACGACYETPGSNSSLIGDLCADTPPTPEASGPCVNYPGTDPCSGSPWGYTMPENYMGYNAQSCLTTFTPEQQGRMRCWTQHVLDSWVIPFVVEAQPVLAPAPAQVDFTASTYKQALNWNWDFGDGGNSPDQNPSHLFNDPGFFDVTVDLQSVDGSFQLEFPGFVSIYADTIEFGHGRFEGLHGYVDIRVHNYVPLGDMEIPFGWGGDVDIRFDSVSAAGLRTEGFDNVGSISYVSSWDVATIRLGAGNAPYMPPGDGAVARLWFTRLNSNQLGSNPIVLTSYAAYELDFQTYAGNYQPENIDGAIEVGCCVGTVGDANGDGSANATIGDISALIDHLFITQFPLDCYAEGDVNQSGGISPGPADITIGDIAALIDHLFISGTTPPACL